MTRHSLVSLLVILLSFIIGVVLYPNLPDKMASHWNISGQVDGYTTKFWGAFLMPIISALSFLIFLAIPKIDPLKKNIALFRGYIELFLLVLVLFLFYLYLLTILWNLGFVFNMIQLLAPAFGGLFYVIGIMLEHAKQNWFIGIRTPWTLSNEIVWDKTHQLGSKIFKFGGLVTVLGALVPGIFFYLMFVTVISTSLLLFAYSYYLYSKLNK